ncbi:hypothetical protein [Saccharopolyspora halophila]|uniref:hypothetical protein n=1 Tax=Saccharopolyspora halophila TaxID=405551 RepID=UPI0031DCBCD7
MSWSGTLPPPETPPETPAETPAGPPAEAPAERTDRLYLPPSLDEAPPSPLAGAGWCREPEVLLRLLEGLAAL